MRQTNILYTLTTDKNILKKTIYNLQNKRRKQIQTFSRKSIVDPIMLNQKIGIYNGNTFKVKEVTSEMFLYKLGSFCPTRIRHVFKQKRQKRKK